MRPTGILEPLGAPAAVDRVFTEGVTNPHRLATMAVFAPTQPSQSGSRVTLDFFSACLPAANKNKT